jgi:hypothetical protein
MLKIISEFFDNGASLLRNCSDATMALGLCLERCRFVAARQKTIVETIEPSEDALSVEDVVKFFSTAFEQICGLSVVEQNFYCKFIWTVGGFRRSVLESLCGWDESILAEDTDLTHSRWRCIPHFPFFLEK